MTEKTKKARRPHGTGSVHLRQRDGRWVATLDLGYTATGGRRRPTITAKSESAAKAALKKMQRDIARDQAETTRMTVKAWSAKWLAIVVKTDRPTTHNANRTAVRRWIVPTIGHRRLDQLTPGDVRAVAEAIEKAGNSTSTSRRYVSTLMVMLKAALEDGHPIPARVLAVKKPKRSVNDRQAVPTPDVLLLLAAAGDVEPRGSGSRWVAAFLQGLRQAEALGLTWDQVDADTITVSWQLKPLPYNVPRDRKSGFRIPDGYESRQVKGALHLVRPKSAAGWRVIPLLPVMGDALTAWRQVAPVSEHGLVWPAADGSPQTSKDDAAAWRALEETAGVAHPTGRPFTGHEARHTTATLLMELGVPEAVRVKIMGHSSIKTTRGYEHVDLSLARDAMARVAQRLQLI